MIDLKSSKLSAQISETGAELRSLKDNSTNTEYIWQRDENIWPDCAPILFPFVARLPGEKYIFNGKEYELKIHGFAKESEFKVIEKTENKVTLELTDSEETYLHYPFHFSFKVTFLLNNNTLSVSYQIENRGDDIMYFGLGSHPGFNVPLEEGISFEDYSIEFPNQNNIKQRIFSDDCFDTGESNPFKLDDNKLNLRHNLFDNDAIILEGSGGEAILSPGKGNRGVKVTYTDTPYLGIWHKVKYPAPYICIEPWYTLPGKKGVITNFENAGLITLKANEKTDRGYSITVH